MEGIWNPSLLSSIVYCYLCLRGVCNRSWGKIGAPSLENPQKFNHSALNKYLAPTLSQTLS